MNVNVVFVCPKHLQITQSSINFDLVEVENGFFINAESILSVYCPECDEHIRIKDIKEYEEKLAVII